MDFSESQAVVVYTDIRPCLVEILYLQGGFGVGYSTKYDVIVRFLLDLSIFAFVFLISNLILLYEHNVEMRAGNAVN